MILNNRRVTTDKVAVICIPLMIPLIKVSTTDWAFINFMRDVFPRKPQRAQAQILET
jgi:hypothetical protein